MQCSDGSVLLEKYFSAARLRASARDDLLLATPCQRRAKQVLSAANRSYNEAFVAWVLHRGSCLTCSLMSLAEDRVQFASV